MKNGTRITGLGVLLALGLFSLARADVAPPDEPRRAPRKQVQRGTSFPLQVEIAGNSDRPQLQIPAQFLRGAGDGSAQAPAPRMIIGGLALSMAVVGGLVLLRRGRVGTKVMMLGGALMLATTGAIAWADLSPPFKPEPQPKIELQVTRGGDAIVLRMSEKTRQSLFGNRGFGGRSREGRRQPTAEPPGVGSAPPSDGAAPPR